jgi:hypothetical protein
MAEQSTWKDDLKKPVNIIGILLGVLGLIGTVYGIVAYYDAHKVQEISFVRNVVRVIDSASAASTIKIFDTHGTLIKENVYVAVYTMWNSGNVNIEPGMVRKSIRFTLHGDGSILESSVVKQNRGHIGEFALASDGIGRASSLAWKYFDKGMGFAVKIIYTGNDKTDLRIDEGYVDGLQPLQNAGEKFETTRSFFNIYRAGLLIVLVFALYSLTAMLRSMRVGKWWTPIAWFQ